jgi:hypothetical protein
VLERQLMTMNNYSHDFNALKSQATYHQAKFRREAVEANTLIMAQQTLTKPVPVKVVSTKATLHAAGSGNPLRKLFARLIHQATPGGF